MNMPLRLAIVFLTAFCLVLPVSAQERTALIYSKTILKIVPNPSAKATPPKGPDAKAKEDKPSSEPSPKPQRITTDFIVEVRPLSFLSQRDFIAHQAFGSKEGMMVVIDPPAPAMLRSANLMGKVDVLFADADGLITNIAPDIALPSLTEPLTTEKPIHAFIFLKGGTAKANDIQPGDKIINPLFKTHPIILDETSPGVKTPQK